MKEFFQENKAVILKVAGVLAVLPLVISGVMLIPYLEFSKGDANGWLSFWGSYLGGIFSGIMTFFGVFMAFKLERENTKKNQARRNYNKTFELFDWTNDLLKYLNNGKRKENVRYLLEKGDMVLDGLANVDSEWYLEAKYINSEIFETWINDIDAIESKREDIEKLHKDVLKYIGRKGA